MDSNNIRLGAGNFCHTVRAMSELRPLEVPLVGANATPGRAWANTCFVGVAISGWLVAALAFAQSVQHVHKAETSNSGLATESIPPQAFLETGGNDGGLDGRELLLTLIRVAGCGQLALVVASAAIPFLLDYRKELGEIKKPLLRQMFLVYSGYILAINFLFGLISALAAESILTVGFLPSVITGFIFLYWFCRLLIALFVFDLAFLNRPHEVVGRVGIEFLFGLLPVTYGVAFAYDMGKLSVNYTIPVPGPFGRMLIIIIVLFMVMKVCVFMMPKSGASQLTWFQTFLFFFFWPGMQPARFRERKSGLDWWKDAFWGTFFLILGALWSVGVKASVDAGLSPAFAGLLSLPGISMMGHVGGLRVLRGALRKVGYDVEQLFTDPFLADSMADFWGTRWNLAFSDMNRFVFVAAMRTALEDDLGVSKARAGQIGVFTAYAASALLHEFGITVPVWAGFGGPSFYFLVQGFCVIVEKQPAVAQWREKFPTIARLFAIVAIAAPFPICFVVPFRTEIALPLTMMVADFPSHAVGLLRRQSRASRAAVGRSKRCSKRWIQH